MFSIAALMLAASLFAMPPAPKLHVAVQDDEVVPVRADGKPVGSREEERFENAKDACSPKVERAIPYDIKEAAMYDEDPIAIAVTASVWTDCMEKQMNASN